LLQVCAVVALWIFWLLSSFWWGCKVQFFHPFLQFLFGSGKFFKMCRWSLRWRDQGTYLDMCCHLPCWGRRVAWVNKYCAVVALWMWWLLSSFWCEVARYKLSIGRRVLWVKKDCALPALWMWWLLSWFVWGCNVQEVQFLWCVFGSGKFLKMCRWLLRWRE
jgi:hypothetical protein